MHTLPSFTIPLVPCNLLFLLHLDACSKEVDEYAARSQKAWAAAQAAGIYQHEVAPIEVKGKKGAPHSAMFDCGMVAYSLHGRNSSAHHAAAR